MREKVKDATFTFRLPSTLREVMESAAKKDQRQTGQWLQVLLVDHFKKTGEYPPQKTT